MIDVFLSSHNLSACYCLDIERRMLMFITLLGVVNIFKFDILNQFISEDGIVERNYNIIAIVAVGLSNKRLNTL